MARAAIVGGADADGIVGDGGPALHQPHAFGPQLLEVTLFRGQAHAVEKVEGVEAAATFEDVSDGQNRVGMGARIERARVPCRPVGPGHREGERLAPQLPTTLVGLAPGSEAWRPADPAHGPGPGPGARALRAAPTSALAAVAAVVVAGRTAATEDRDRDSDGRLALGAAATTVAALRIGRQVVRSAELCQRVPTRTAREVLRGAFLACSQGETTTAPTTALVRWLVYGAVEGNHLAQAL